VLVPANRGEPVHPLPGQRQERTQHPRGGESSNGKIWISGLEISFWRLKERAKPNLNIGQEVFGLHALFFQQDRIRNGCTQAGASRWTTNGRDRGTPRQHNHLERPEASMASIRLVLALRRRPTIRVVSPSPTFKSESSSNFLKKSSSICSENCAKYTFNAFFLSSP